MRGYAAIGLHATKTDANIGGALRAAQAHGAGLVVLQGERVRYSTDTMKAWRHIPVITKVKSVLDHCPYGAVPVAVELTTTAKSLALYEHPQRAFYIFGPEDGSVPKTVMARCRDIVRIPGGCLNLAAAVNVVLYDRNAKSERKEVA